MKITGKMKLNRLLICFFAISVAFGAFSQNKAIEYPFTHVIGKDTVITFTFSQGKKLAILNEERKRLEELNKIINTQSSKKDTIIKQQADQLKLFQKVRDDYQVIILEKDALQQTCNDEKAILEDEVKKKNRHKWYAIFSGIAGVGIMTYFYITK